MSAEGCAELTFELDGLIDHLEGLTGRLGLGLDAIRDTLVEDDPLNRLDIELSDAAVSLRMISTALSTSIDGWLEANEDGAAILDEDLQAVFRRHGPVGERLCDWRKCTVEPWFTLAEAVPAP